MPEEVMLFLDSDVTTFISDKGNWTVEVKLHTS
jgi:hypothetical protein